MENYDVVRGIFGGKVGTKSITCAALQAEANTDFAEAVTLYNEVRKPSRDSPSCLFESCSVYTEVLSSQALNTEDWPDGEPSESEKDFWEMAAMEAYSQLTEWKSVQYCSTVYIDDNAPPNLEKMWSEPLYQVVPHNQDPQYGTFNITAEAIVTSFLFDFF